VIQTAVTSTPSNAGAAIFRVDSPAAAPESITSPPDVNPFLNDERIVPITDTSIAANPFADAKPQSDPCQQVIKPDSLQEVEHIETKPIQAETSITEPERPQTLVTEMVGGLEVSTSDMLQKLEIAKTPVVPELVKEAPSDTDSDSESEIDFNKPETQETESLENVSAAPEINIMDTEPEPTEPKETGNFSGIFSSELGETTETIQSATSHVDLNSDSDTPEQTEQSNENKAEGTEEVSETKQEAEASTVDDIGPQEVYQTGGTAAGLFGDVPQEGPVLSTGDALFADLPSVPNIKSTGAAIFGLSEESAAGSTGAALFDIVAPEQSKPSHGQMSGWDDNFDKKFEKAELNAAAGPVDAFGGPGTNTAAAFGYGAPPAFGDGPSFGDSFGMLPVAADMNNPFLAEGAQGFPGPGEKSGDGEDAESPLFDSDVSKPLEAFPRLHHETEGWDMYIRHPPKKKITAQRFWKKVHVKIVNQGDNPVILLFDSKENKDPFQELPLQAAYSLSDISHQVFDQYSKVFTIKLQYIFYKERAGIRPGQVSKMQKLTDKIGFLAKAVEDADYQGVKEFASDMKKLGVPLEHAPQISELLKLASYSYEDMKQFSVCIEERLFRLDVHRDRALTYKTEEVQMTAVDEVYVEQTAEGHTVKHLCRVRVFFLSFLTGMPEVDLGVNDMTRMGLEVVGRHDILPVPTEQWIRYEDIEFHNVVNQKAFEAEDHIIKFQPPDGCYIEVMRFRTRPPRARELPMQARCSFNITGNKVEIRADIMVPYHATKAWGQVPCEDVAMRIPLPECWIYQFRTEKHNLSLSQVRDSLSSGHFNLATRMGSVKSAHRRAGKVKGLDRFLGTLETASQEIMETSSGIAKYEHQHKSIVWRVPRLPKQGQGSYTTHEFVCRLTLQNFDQVPETFEKFCYLEFTQPATSESYTVLRSVSIAEGSGEPPEKFVKYLARHEYKIGIKFEEGREKDAYRTATAAVPTPVVQEEPELKEYEDFPDENGRAQDSDSDSD